MKRKDLFLEAMEYRFACKLFDENRTIDRRDFLDILEYGRLSPSSFGMEPWRFVVITDRKRKEALRPLCWNQPQITTCSHLVVIAGDVDAVQNDEYIEAMFARRGLDEKSTKAYIRRYKAFLQHQDIECWVQKQCYIAAANMMTGAAFKKIDSCPIEGFEKEKVEDFLGVSNIALLIAFGYCAMQKPPKRRLSLEKITTFI